MQRTIQQKGQSVLLLITLTNEPLQPPILLPNGCLRPAQSQPGCVGFIFPLSDPWREWQEFLTQNSLREAVSDLVDRMLAQSGLSKMCLVV